MVLSLGEEETSWWIIQSPEEAFVGLPRMMIYEDGFRLLVECIDTVIRLC